MDTLWKKSAILFPVLGGAQSFFLNFANGLELQFPMLQPVSLAVPQL
jgi:hypothetical protein